MNVPGLWALNKMSPGHTRIPTCIYGSYERIWLKIVSPGVSGKFLISPGSARDRAIPKMQPRPLRRYSNWLNATHMTTRNELPGVGSPGTHVCMHGVALPRTNRARANSAISNKYSLQDMHACTSYYQSCDIRQICIYAMGCYLVGPHYARAERASRT